VAKISIDFPKRQNYLDIKAAAVKQDKKVGDFIVELYEYWKEHHQ
jgi:hypothetical protein